MYLLLYTISFVELLYHDTFQCQDIGATPLVPFISRGKMVRPQFRFARDVMALRSRVEAAMFDHDAVVNDPNKYFWMNGITQCSMIN